MTTDPEFFSMEAGNSQIGWLPSALMAALALASCTVREAQILATVLLQG